MGFFVVFCVHPLLIQEQFLLLPCILVFVPPWELAYGKVPLSSAHPPFCLNRSRRGTSLDPVFRSKKGMTNSSSHALPNFLSSQHDVSSHQDTITIYTRLIMVLALMFVVLMCEILCWRTLSHCFPLFDNPL